MSSSPRVLLVGQRRFVNPVNPWRGAWDWPAMLKFPSVDEKRTPMAYRRVAASGLEYVASVDLLPPGLDWNAREAEQSAARIEAWAFNSRGGDFDSIVLLGGRVSAAFDIQGLFRYEDGFLVLPSPHCRAETAWDTDSGIARIRDVVAEMRECEIARKRSAS